MIKILLSKDALVKWNSANKKWFESKGYFYTKMGDEFKVKIEDLSKGSHSIIKYSCDYCDEIIEAEYKVYLNNKKKSHTKKDCCKKCVGKKDKETNIDKYGLESLTGTEEYNKKASKTNLERYGYKHSSQNPMIKEKGKKTRIKQANKRIIIYKDYAEVILGNKKVTIIDLEDVEKVKNYKWNQLKNGYIKTIIDKQTIYLHRLVTNCPDDMEVDHEDHDKLNNRKYNLRICTSQENSRNHRLHKSNTSGINGVSWSEKQGVWCGFIGIDNKTVYLGCSENIEEVKEIRELADNTIFKEYKYNPNIDKGVIYDL